MASPHRWSPWRLLAASVALYGFLRHAQADEAALPGEWRTGIATNYGGAQDGMVRWPLTACLLPKVMCF